MRAVLEEGLEVSLAVEVLPEAQDPEVYLGLDHVPVHRLGESKFSVLKCICVICRA